MKTIKVLAICLTILVLINSCNNANTLKNGNIEQIIAFENSLTEMQIGKSNYYISLPVNYIIEEKEGIDFSVYYFVPKDTTLKASFKGGMYFGNFPSEFAPENDSCKTSQIKNKLLEEYREWTVYNCNGKYEIQTITDSKSGEDWNEKIHAFGSAKSESDMKKLLIIYTTFKQKKNHK